MLKRNHHRSLAMGRWRLGDLPMKPTRMVMAVPPRASVSRSRAACATRLAALYKLGIGRIVMIRITTHGTHEAPRPRGQRTVWLPAQRLSLCERSLLDG